MEGDPLTYPAELQENTTLHDKHYPLNVFRNRYPAGRNKGMILGLHWHEHYEIIWMLSGEAVFHIDSVVYSASPGDILLVPAGGLHVGYSAGEEATEYIALVCNASLLTSASLSPDPAYTQYLLPYLSNRVRFPVKLDGEDPANTVYRELLQRIVDEFEGRDRAYELVVKANLQLLFTLLSRRFLPEQITDSSSTSSYARNNERFKPLFRYVEEHYAKKLTVEHAAKLLNLNPYHFCKIFKRATGRTYIEYVNLLKIKEAERMLKETDLTVTEIADQVGCGNANYFTKLFKQYKGISPSEYRRAMT